MRTAKLIAALFLALTLVGCGGGDEEKGESAGEVVKKYTDRLSTAPEKAREVSRKMEDRTKDLADRLRALE